MTRLLPLAVLALLPAAALAGKTLTKQHSTAADHEKSSRKGVLVADDGTVSLSPRASALPGIDALQVWSVVEADGAVYAALGEAGKVVRLAEGTAKVVYETDGAHLQTLCVADKGKVVFAGKGPGAEIVRIAGTEAKAFCTLPETYVWTIVADGAGNLFAGTGPNGRVYRVTPDGKASVFFETKQDHVVALALDPAGNVYAGTDKTGRVYKIDPAGKGVVVHQAAQSEIGALLWTPEALYAGTRGVKKRAPGAVASESAGSSAKADGDKDKDTAPAAATKEKAAVVAKTVSRSKESTKSTPASAPSEPSVGENSVWRIAPDGAVREVFRDKCVVLSLAKRGKKLLVGTGMKGKLFEVDESTRAKVELLASDHGQILSLCPRSSGGVYLGVGDAGGVLLLEDRAGESGTLTSAVIDAKLPSRWGQVERRGETPAGTKVAVSVRTGNVEEPDDTWSAWTPENAAAAFSPGVASGRYAQYRVTLTGKDGASPTLAGVVLRHASHNLAPEVTKVDVPDAGAVVAEGAKKVKFKWAATDANEDELRYTLAVKKDGWDEWVVIEEDFDKTEYEWDTTTTPSGSYKLRVTASDAADNDAKDALVGERTGAAFAVCHEAPAVTLTQKAFADGRVTFAAKATSAHVRIVAASFTVNGKARTGVRPADGLFDAKEEAFAFTTDAIPAGGVVVVLRVTDAAGNTATADVVVKRK